MSWGASFLSHVVTLAAALVLYIYDANCRPEEKELRTRCANAVVWSTVVANFTGLVSLFNSKKQKPPVVGGPVAEVKELEMGPTFYVECLASALKRSERLCILALVPRNFWK